MPASCGYTNLPIITLRPVLPTPDQSGPRWNIGVPLVEQIFRYNRPYRETARNVLTAFKGVDPSGTPSDCNAMAKRLTLLGTKAAHGQKWTFVTEFHVRNPEGAIVGSVLIITTPMFADVMLFKVQGEILDPSDSSVCIEESPGSPKFIRLLTHGDTQLAELLKATCQRLMR